MCTDKLLCWSVLILYNFIYICSAVLSIIPSVSIFFFFFFFAVIIYNFTKGHNISLPRCAPLLLSIFSIFCNSGSELFVVSQSSQVGQSAHLFQTMHICHGKTCFEFEPTFGLCEFLHMAAKLDTFKDSLCVGSDLLKYAGCIFH